MFVRLLVSLFLIFFATTLVTGIVNYVTVRSALPEQAYGRNLEVLRQTSRIIETVLDATERTAARLAHNRIVQSVTLADWATIEDHYPALIQVRGMLEDELASSIYTHSVFLVSPSNERVLSASGILRFEDYPDTDLLAAARGGTAPSSWVGPRVTTRVDGRRANVITLLMDVPAGPVEQRGLLIVNLDERLFYDTVVSRKQANAGSLAILNQDSVVLSVADKSLLTERLTLRELYPSLEGMSEGYAVISEQYGTQFVSLITSPYNGWQYVSSAPYDQIMAASRGILVLSVGVSLLFLCIGLGLSVVVSRRFYRPIQTLVNLIGNPLAVDRGGASSPRSATATDEFEMIYASVDTLLRENRKYQDCYAATDAILREHFLVDLVLGRARERSDLRREALAFGLDLAALHYAVIVLRVVPDALGTAGYHARLRKLRYRVYGIASGVLNRYARGFVVDLGKTDVVLGVLSDSDDPLAVCRTIAANTRAVIATDLGIDTSYGIGSPEPTHDGLSTSYERAVLALEYALPSASGSIVAMDDVVSDVQIHSVIIAYRRQIDDVLYAFRHQEYDRAIELAGAYTAASHLAQRSTIRRRDFVGRTERFVSERSSEPIGLNEAAEYLHMNRQYFCRVFKAAFGTTFGDNLAARRLRTAVELLESTNRPVGEVAAEAGFPNARSFVRAFRTAKGTTPTKYRLSHHAQTPEFANTRT